MSNKELENESLGSRIRHRNPEPIPLIHQLIKRVKQNVVLGLPQKAPHACKQVPYFDWRLRLQSGFAKSVAL
jgi:hypothetical protein